MPGGPDALCGPSLTVMASSRNELPLTQPARALKVLAGYLLAVAVAFGVCFRLFDGPLVLIATGGLAALLAVVAAVVAPLPRDDRPTGTAPVLQRPRRQDRPPTGTSGAGT